MSENHHSNGSEDLQETCAMLQHQLNSVLILTCVVSLTLTIFFFLPVLAHHNHRRLQGCKA